MRWRLQQPVRKASGWDERPMGCELAGGGRPFGSGTAAGPSAVGTRWGSRASRTRCRPLIAFLPSCPMGHGVATCLRAAPSGTLCGWAAVGIHLRTGPGRWPGRFGRADPDKPGSGASQGLRTPCADLVPGGSGQFLSYCRGSPERACTWDQRGGSELLRPPAGQYGRMQTRSGSVTKSAKRAQPFTLSDHSWDACGRRSVLSPLADGECCCL